jgi:type I restriction enzyme S subunit
MANINAQELQNIRILIPPKALQDVYAIMVDTIKQLKNNTHLKAEKSEKLFNCLLEKAFKGELVN